MSSYCFTSYQSLVVALLLLVEYLNPIASFGLLPAGLKPIYEKYR
ncbi:hypothetical protein GRAN_1203 [Granulicella sibirica]|uniref:Uncharacterized protein n=1 Tax=Granulicella sibirica TaxID=2479048 RepID=A0A4Q0T2Q1_9BACT|nr:hypothetical protein GRAN_1203 [Granulicella sibirica]